MVAIALDELVISHRDGARYPILTLTDNSGESVDLIVCEDPREAYFRLSGLAAAATRHQTRLPITKVKEQ